jgi:peptidoglycan/xylan/chitin deacetylase (PgdA/CDA1 family)
VCGWLRNWFEVVPLAEGCLRLRDETLPARSLAITFDDGYADNHAVAAPILRKHGLLATFFVATVFLDGGRMWNDTVIESVRRTTRDVLDFGDRVAPGVERLAVCTLGERRAAIDRLIAACRYLAPSQRLAAIEAIADTAGSDLPRDLMMSSAQVRELHRDGMSVGGHTVNHPILARLPPGEAREEIAVGKAHLEAITQTPVSLFAYPNGRPGEDFRAEHVAMVRELGFEAAVTTAWGAATCSDDPYQIPRFTPWDRSRLRFGLRLARNLRTDTSRARGSPLLSSQA